MENNESSHIVENPRREFIQKSALGAIGLALATGLMSSSANINQLFRPQN